MSRTPDERLYSSGSRDSFYFHPMLRQLWRSGRRRLRLHQVRRRRDLHISPVFPTAIGESPPLTSGTISWSTAFRTPVRLPGGKTVNDQYGRLASQAVADEPLHPHFHRRQQGRCLAIRGRRNSSGPGEPSGYRDGSLANLQSQILTAYANFNEEFPLFNWYVVETDVTRYKNTGTHVVYDAGGPADGTPCGASVSYPTRVRNIHDRQIPGEYRRTVSVPTNLRVPGAVYCADADCMYSARLLD